MPESRLYAWYNICFRGFYMRRLVLIFLTSLGMLAGFGGTAFAQDFTAKPYIGLALGGYTLKANTPSFNQSNTAFGGHIAVGSDFGDYLGLELRLGTTSNPSSSYPAGTLGAGTPGFTVKMGVNTYFSYLAKLQVPLSPQFKIYGLLGGTTASIKFDSTYAPVSTGISTNKTDLSYGGGFRYTINDSLDIAGEAMVYWQNANLGAGAKGSIYGYTGQAIWKF